MLQSTKVINGSRVAKGEFLKIATFSGLLILVLLVSLFNLYLGFCAFALVVAGPILGINLRWALLAFVFLVPFDPQVELPGKIVLYFDLFFAALIWPFAWGVQEGRFRLNRASLWLAPYVLYAIATTFWRAENAYWFSGYSVRLAIAVLFMTVVGTLARSETVTLVLGLSLVPQVAYGLYQLWTADLGALYRLIYPHYEQQPWTDRAYGFFFQPNNFGGYCAIITVMLFSLGLKTQRRALRVLHYALGGLGLVGVASSGSRGAWLGLFAGALLLMAFSRVSVRAKLVLAAVMIAGILLLASLEYLPLTRAQSLDAFTIEGRSTLYLAAWLLFIKHPVIGVGTTNYQELMPHVVDWKYGVGNASHSTYLQVLSENGIVGFCLFFGPAFYFFYRSSKAAKESPEALIGSAGLMVFFVHALFDVQLIAAPQYLLLFAILFGLASKNIRSVPVLKGSG